MTAPAMPAALLIQPTSETEPYIVREGQIVIVHARWTQERGPEDCVGIFKAKRDFDPVAEHRLYQHEHPEAGPPQSWSIQTRQHYALWGLRQRGYLEDVKPTYLFLEPFETEIPGKVAHGD